MDLSKIAKRPVSKEAAHAEAMRRGADCESCAFYGSRRGPVMGDTIPNPRLLIIAESPTQLDVAHGRPLIGPAGDVVNSALEQGGIHRHECSVHNVIACQPDENLSVYLIKEAKRHRRLVRQAESKGLPPPVAAKSPIDCCRPRLQYDIKNSSAKHILAIGGHALAAVAKEYGLTYGRDSDEDGKPFVATIMNQHGSPVRLPDGTILSSSLHPAFAMREKAYKQVVINDIARAASICVRGSIDWVAPKPILFVGNASNPVEISPDNWLKVIQDTCVKFIQYKDQVEVAFDIETDGIDTQVCEVRCIGLGTKFPGEDLETVLVVPFRYMDGRAFWSNLYEEESAKAAVRQVLDECKLIAQNGAFDTGVCQRVGLMSRDPVLSPSKMKPFFDTMLAHKNSDSVDLPHGLGFITRQYTEAPLWKENCLHGDDRIVCADGERRRIEDIVRHKWCGPVLGLDSDGLYKEAAITDWYKINEATKWWSIRTEWDPKNSRGLVVTPDHKVFTERGIIRADSVGVTDKIVFPEEELSQEALGALLGTFLGDGTIHVAANYFKDKHKALSVGIGGGQVKKGDNCLSYDKQLALPWLIKCSPPVFYKTSYNKQGSWFVNWRTPALRSIRHLIPYMAKDGRKIISLELVKLLGPIGWAWLFMDDGSRINTWRDPRRNGKRGGQLFRPETVSFALCAFERTDLLQVVEWCKTFFNGPVWLNSRNDMRFGVASSRNFAEYVAPYIFPSQRYKLPRDISLPSFVGHELKRTNKPTYARVVSSGLTEVVRGANQQYCLTTETGNFFTSLGLVKNCDHKDSGGVRKDYELHRYNGMDITTTYRIKKSIQDRIFQCGTTGSFQTDSTLVPVAREMTNMGIVIDEVWRGRLSRKFNRLTRELAADFQRLAGKDINPRSPTQLSDWLFGDLGYTPLLNPSGFQYDSEEDDPSTSTPALTALIDQGIDSNTAEALDRLLQFRACETIRGRSVDKLPVRYIQDSVLDQAGLAEPVIVDGEEKFGIRPALSVLNPTWKLTPNTGRWASAPNVQNYSSRGWMVQNDDPDQVNEDGTLKIDPKTGESFPAKTPTNLRRLVVAPPGHVLINADFDQVELRLIAIIAQDDITIGAIQNGLDPHTLNFASMIVDRPENLMKQYAELLEMKKTKEGAAKLKHLRTIAKKLVFLISYAGEGSKLYQTMSQERDKSNGTRTFPNLRQRDVNGWFNRYHQSHPAIRRWHAQVEKDIRQYGYVESIIDGRRRYFDRGVLDKAAINARIQMSSAALTNRALIGIAEEIPFRCWSRWTGLWANHHDAVQVCVPEDKAEKAKEIVERNMRYEYEGMKFTATGVISKDWSKAD